MLLFTCRREIFQAGPSNERSTSTRLSAVDLPTVICFTGKTQQPKNEGMQLWGSECFIGNHTHTHTKSKLGNKESKITVLRIKQKPEKLI